MNNSITNLVEFDRLNSTIEGSNKVLRKKRNRKEDSTKKMTKI